MKSNQDFFRPTKGKNDSDKSVTVDLSTAPPFLRWAGSKRKVLDRIVRYWRPNGFKRYVEPFAGSACVFFHIAPRRALLADINKRLIETFITVRDDVESVIDLLANAENSEEKYYQIRSIDFLNLTSSERAAQFIYLNRYCFNGLYRTNLDGRFNVPYGGNRTGHLPSPTHLRHCSLLLRRAKIVAADFEKVLENVVEGDFVYLDPPYQVKKRRVFSEYDSTNFDDKSVKRLRKGLQFLKKKGIPFVLTYTACPEAQYLSKGFHVERMLVRRNIAGFSGKRVQRRELLISSHAPD